MPADDTVLYLGWDSAFFGLRIARVTSRALTDSILAYLWERLEAQPVDCLYFLASASDPTTVQCAEAAGFRLVDVRITLEGRFTEGRGKRFATRVRLFQPGDLPALRRIAAESHTETRFFRDPHFARDKCRELYETWIEKSCHDPAHAVLVADAGGQAAGYFTCEPDGARGRIGLVAVSNACRRQGLGAELVNAGVDWFTSHGMTEVSVVTQGANLSAVRLYENAGFHVAAMELWYHKWFGHSDLAAGTAPSGGR